MRRVLVAFTSQEGQTHHIAHHVARQLEDKGFLVRLIDILEKETEAGADDCEAVILASSIHRGSYHHAMSSFIMRHGPRLRAVPSAFLSVSLSAASDEADEQAAIDEISRKFLAENGWAPERVKQVAGALHDRELGFVERQVLHGILDSKGVARHPSGNTEFTDWSDLDKFLAEFAPLVPAPPADDQSS
jgi:menaquinone-dependent protoporphyrinogen oxidase